LRIDRTVEISVIVNGPLLLRLPYIYAVVFLM
jgi:hypothetical protein